MPRTIGSAPGTAFSPFGQLAPPGASPAQQRYAQRRATGMNVGQQKAQNAPSPGFAASPGGTGWNVNVPPLRY